MQQVPVEQYRLDPLKIHSSPNKLQAFDDHERQRHRRLYFPLRLRFHCAFFQCFLPGVLLILLKMFVAQSHAVLFCFDLKAPIIFSGKRFTAIPSCQASLLVSVKSAALRLALRIFFAAVDAVKFTTVPKIIRELTGISTKCVAWPYMRIQRPYFWKSKKEWAMVSPTK